MKWGQLLSDCTLLLYTCWMLMSLKSSNLSPIQREIEPIEVGVRSADSGIISTARRKIVSGTQWEVEVVHPCHQRERRSLRLFEGVGIKGQVDMRRFKTTLLQYLLRFLGPHLQSIDRDDVSPLNRGKGSS